MKVGKRCACMILFGVVYAATSPACSSARDEHMPAARARRPSSPTTAKSRPVEPEKTTPEPTAIAPFVPMVGNAVSMGSPVAGALSNAVQIPEGGFGFRHNPKRSRSAGYSSVEMLNALMFTGYQVAKTHDHAILTINDLSLVEGGPIPHHGSHQNGRDVDTLFYMRRHDTGERYPSVGAFFDREGQGVDFGDLSDPADDVLLDLDLAATWRFVEVLVAEQTYARVQRIFVAEHIRSMLLEYAREHGGNGNAIDIFSKVTCQPSYPHDDHFHIRIFCAPDHIKQGCRDAHPLYEEQKAYLKQLGIRPKVAGPKRFKSKITTFAEAEEKTKKRKKPIDKQVRAWIAKRKNWQEKPHPGRLFCR